MKVGDLVSIGETEKLGMIIDFISFERGKNPQPVVMVEGRPRLYGTGVCKVVTENS